MIAKGQSYYREKCVKFTDKRVTGMKEIIDAIRLIKMYAWEESFLTKIFETRKLELSKLVKSAFMGSLTLTVGPSISILAGFGTFITMTLAGVELDSTQAFTVMSVFSALQFAISSIPWAVRYSAEAMVGLQRIQSFLGTSHSFNQHKENFISICLCH